MSTSALRAYSRLRHAISSSLIQSQRIDIYAVYRQETNLSLAGTNTCTHKNSFSIQARVFAPSKRISGTGDCSPCYDKAMKWINTAQNDYSIGKILILHMCMKDEGPKSYNWVCFLAHDTIEKALKAAMLAMCGLRKEDFHCHTRLKDYVNCLIKKHPEFSADLTKSVEVIAPYYNKSRWPNCWPDHEAPNEQFHRNQAEAALLFAGKTLVIAENIIKMCSL